MSEMVAVSRYELSEQETKLVNGLQSAFSNASGLEKLDLYLRSKEATLLFFSEGNAIPPIVQNPPEAAGTKSFLAIPSGAVDILVRCPDQPGAQSLAGLLVKHATELLEAKEREELLMEEIAAGWESLDALCEISTDVFTSNTKECLNRLIKRLACLKDGFDGALFLQEGEDRGSIQTADAESKVVPIADLGMVQRVLKERTSIVLNGLAAGAVEAGEDICWRTARSLAAVPMMSRDAVRGFVIVWSESAEQHIDTSFQHLIDALSNRVSMLLECEELTQSARDTELLEQEIGIASIIQNTLLCGEVPASFAGVRFAALTIPSRTIDGDFYDFYQQRERTIDLLIGDVMGKGVAAALLGTAVKNEFTRAVVSQVTTSHGEQLSPESIVRHVSKKLNPRLIQLERFVTLCYARLNMSERRLDYVDCGHMGTIVHRRKCMHSFVLEGVSLPLGIDVKDFPCERSFNFEPGDTFLFYSDRVTENVSPTGELFGAERLIECVEQWSSCGPDIILDQLCREARRYSGKTLFADDFTALAVKVNLEEVAPTHVRAAQFDRSLEQLDAVRVWLSEAASLVGDTGLDEDAVTRLLLVSIEAFDNCVIHAPEGAPSCPVCLQAETFADSLRVTFRHAAPEFDPFHAAQPSFDGSRDNGFGLYIMLRSADEFAYRHEPEGINTLTFSILQRKEEMTCHADNDHTCE